MLSQREQTLLFPTIKGLAMTSGYSTRLAKGQFGIIDKGADPTSLGSVVTTTFPTSPKNRLFELKLGAADLNVNRSQSNKAWSSVPFKLSEVVDISVTAPSLKVSVDSFILGYDGINDDSAIVLKNGDNEVIDITLSGEAIGMLGYSNSTVTVQLYLSAPLGDEAFTMHEIIENAVKEFKNIKLLGDVPITNYIKINPVNSENPASITGKDYTFYTLKIKDDGRFSDLALVQAQYPTQVVKKLDHDIDGYTTYVILAEAGTTLADYTATDVTLKDADCDGVPEVTSSSVDTAWVAGDTCTAVQKNYTIQLADDDCGSNKLAKLQAVYPELTILVDTPNQSQTITLTGTSGTANVTIGGVDYLATFASDLATTQANFVTAHKTAIESATGGTFTGTGATLTLVAPSTGFPIISVTNVTGDLAGTVAAVVGSGTATTGGCQTVYNTKVFTEVVCEECDPILRDLFIAEAPHDFEFVSWVEEPTVYSETAKMGIKVEGLYNIFAGSEEYRDDVPHIYSSTRISIANDAPGYVNENYNAGTNGRFKVKVLSIASEPEGLGMDLFALENYSRAFFTGTDRHEGNNYARYILGEESHLSPLKRYIQYMITIDTKRYAQSTDDSIIRYIVAVEVGRQATVETVINALATAVKLPTVSAY